MVEYCSFFFVYGLWMFFIGFGIVYWFFVVCGGLVWVWVCYYVDVFVYLLLSLCMKFVGICDNMCEIIW